MRFLLLLFFSFSLFASNILPIPETTFEAQRILIHNVLNGDIKGSKDGGKTWTLLGHVISPLNGGIWLPSVENGVKAFDFHRGASSVFASAINNIHIRLSDPKGYTLPSNTAIPPIIAHGFSIVPKIENSTFLDTDKNKSILTDINGGTGIFGKDWSPEVGDSVLMGDGLTFNSIPYEYSPNSTIEDMSYVLLITMKREKEVDYLEFENKVNGKVLVKMSNEEPKQVAKVVQTVSGIGRFGGSEYTKKMGTIRANHAGVICVATTDTYLDTNPSNDINERRGGFQIVPSHHYLDSSMQGGGDHPFVYLVVGPIIDPPSLIRYDLGVDGQYPFFKFSYRAGNGHTYFKFYNDSNWYEMSDALAKNKFKGSDNRVIHHLKGYIKDALYNVSSIRIFLK